MREYENKTLTKRFDNFQLYMYTDIISHIRALLTDNDGISEQTWNLFDKFYYSIHNDIGHLECDEYTNIYIVEKGHNCK